ncbi:MAG TPA: stress responsive protein [Bacteroidales bacterium]|nr:stress responsive protein [Bacteroidales bacterium]
MLKHIVFFKLKEEYTENQKQATAIALKNMLLNLTQHISEIRYFEVGIDINRTERAFDLSLISDFENLDTLASYQTHSEHVKVIKFVKEHCQQTAVVDYNYGK